MTALLSAISGNFGVGTPGLCATCCKDSFCILSVAPAGKEDDYLYRRMTVNLGCQRCAAAHLLQLDTFTIALPRALVTSALILESKCFANKRWGTKPPNAELQLATMVGEHRCSDAYKLALVQVGTSAIRHERTFARNGLSLKFFMMWTYASGYAGLIAGLGLLLFHPRRYRGMRFEWLELARYRLLAFAFCGYGSYRMLIALIVTMLEDQSTAWMSRTSFDMLGPLGRIGYIRAFRNYFESLRKPQFGPLGPTAGDLIDGAGPDDGEAPAVTETSSRPRQDPHGSTEETQPVDASAEVVGIVAAVEASVRVAEQQACHVDGASIQAKPFPVTHSTAEVSNTSVMPCDVIGSREAFPRFPHMGKECFMFQNGPKELESAEALRNKDVGTWAPHARERAALKTMVDELIRQVFTQAQVDEVMFGFESYRQTLPNKLSDDAKDKILHDLMNEFATGCVDFSRVVDAFVKAEVSLKPKPRAIANHGFIRMMAMARVAYIFEHVMFALLRKASIKARPKKAAISEIAEGFNKMRSGVIVENDLTAFEFGISEALKHAEQRIFRHIATLTSPDETCNMCLSRVCNARDKSATWKLRFTDEAGAPCVFKLKLPNTMRESGDRFTSSGNWLQNLLAWGSFLATPKSIPKAIGLMISSGGRDFFYESARDGSKQLARLAFEGDDTLAKLSEFHCLPPGLTDDPIEQFFCRWGWKSKLKYAREVGDATSQFVGYNLLVRDNKFVVGGDGEFVMLPRIKEVLCSKQWSMSTISPEARDACVRVYAAAMGAEFARLEPMHAFFRALWNDTTKPTTLRSSELDEARGCYLRLKGSMPTQEELVAFALEDSDFAELSVTTPDHRLLAEMTTGVASDEEWAAMCGLTTLKVHGEDLRAFVPAAWVA